MRFLYLVVLLVLTLIMVASGFETFYSPSKVHGDISLTSRISDARLIVQILVYLLLIIGLVGIIRGTIDFFILGKNFDPDSHLNDVVYEKIVHRTADYLILFGGALLFLWLL